MNDADMSFADLGLDEKTLRAVQLKGFKTPSPIQVLAIPRLLEGESNMIAKARTGTGKTAAFGLPLVQKITEETDYPQALILTPTRELCLQVCKEIESFSTNAFPRMVACYGGQGMGEQIRALKKGLEIVVGTPGRVQDLMERGILTLDKISYFILDEADEMLDMGFIDDIKAIFAKANADSRILLFSATMPKEILQIASDFMGDYEIIEEEKRPEEPLLTQQEYWLVRENEKIEALVRLIDISPDFYGLVFTQTKIDADSVSRQLEERGYEAAALHGDIAQAQREKILWRFRNRKTRILVATDVAARGIDIEGLTHVVNYALPFDAATYVHRIGRTGRAGKTGFAYTFVRPEERRKLEFLKKAQFKSTKGELKEGKIPSIEEVLKTKREKLFEQTRQKLTEQENAATLLASGVNPESEGLEAEAKTKTSFDEMAKILCQEKDPIQVLSSILAMSYGKSLDPSRYGEITPLKVFNQGRQIRLYVQLGRIDGHNARSIAEYFSKLLHISQRFVDQIDVGDKFTLLSLPYQAGMDLLARSEKDKSLPHMHIDSKSSFGNASSAGDRRSSKGRREVKGSSGRRNFSRDRGKSGSRQGEFSSKGKKSGFSGRRESGKKPLHSSGTNKASLYKK
ncbi:MAG: DEAD/DEAH box helicase [Treponemataceae bacterium]|nr:DEAD/DEAH box helicase [Treponemataceae bacterium]